MKVHWSIWVVALAAAAVFSPMAWEKFQADMAREAAVRLQPDNGPVVRQGEKLYQAHCAQCHGKDLEGEADWRQRLANGRMKAPPHDETGHTWHHPDAVLFAVTKYGPSNVVGGGYKSNMPGYNSVLSDEEIIAVLSFIKSTWPIHIRKRHDKISAQPQ